MTPIHMCLDHIKPSNHLSLSSPRKKTFSPYSSPRKTPVVTKRMFTLTPQGDRFIPIRSQFDLEVSHFDFLKENSKPNACDTTPSHENYKNTLADSLFEGKMRSPRVLSFASPRKR